MIEPKGTLRRIERIAHPVKSRSGKETLERNERTVDLPPEVLEDLRALMTGFVLRAYPEMDAFYEALAHWSGFSVSELLATDGADGGVHRVFATYVAEGDRVVILSPSYAMYPVYCQMYGAIPRRLTFNERLELPFEDVLSAAAPGIRLMALANPNQPIESCLSAAQLSQLAQRCARHGILLLLDEAYHHFCDVTAAPLIRTFDNVMVARSFSKAFGLAGLRIGYLMAAPPVITALRALKPIYEISHLNAAIATYFLKRPQLMETYVASVRAGREVLTSFCARHGWTVHGRHSNTVLVGLPPGVSAPRLTTALGERGWLVRAETEPPTPNHLRITIGPPEQMQRLCGLLEGLVTDQRPMLAGGVRSAGPE
jgi:histidinol-phosphate aminotransferase